MSDSTLPEKASSKADPPVNAVTGAQRLAAELKALTDSAKTEAKRLLVAAGQELIDANLAVSQAEERRDRAANEVAALQKIIGDVPWQIQVHTTTTAADSNREKYDITVPGERNDCKPYTNVDELLFDYVARSKRTGRAVKPADA